MITVNAMGDICPIPVVKTKKAMDALTGPEQIEVLVDNETAVRNVMKLAKTERVPGADHSGRKRREAQRAGSIGWEDSSGRKSSIERDGGSRRRQRGRSGSGGRKPGSAGLCFLHRHSGGHRL